MYQSRRSLGGVGRRLQMCLVSQNSNPAWYRRTVNHFIHLFKLYLRFFFFFLPQVSPPGLTLAVGD